MRRVCHIQRLRAIGEVVGEPWHLPVGARQAVAVKLSRLI
jgi:hypothetical protein